MVIIGAGFAGLETARALSGAEVDVVLLDRKNHHCFQPLLYQVATAALSPADVAWPIRSIVSDQDNVIVIMADVCAVDTTSKIVRTKEGDSFHYDYLVIATGAYSSYFNHPEWAQYAPGLKTIEDATRIRAKILIGFERAEKGTSEAEIQKFMTFVVVGGGPTGVELAGSIAEIARSVLVRDFRRINPQSARIVLAEAGPRILSTFPTDLSDYTEKTLTDVGVEVITGRAVTSCDEQGVSLAGGERIETACVLWAAGVKASPAAEWLGVEGDRAGRVPVNEFLLIPGSSNVFVIGDTASVRGGGEPVPGLAPAAKQMGRHVGRHITAIVAGAKPRQSFVYRHQGDLATIGRKAAVVAFSRTKLRGFLGWLVWSVAHIYFLIGARNRAVVAINWVWEYITFQRGARLIS
ncbi:NAD(P)/FAD-dependent oxidoreductase [Bradyrhizobium archetypum]|uniref:NAD(P)/FAD-dependent oxidoreductase n=1 Tax=Bradyrhizobium archetypum TaxID=2721160 RepID=UPI002896BE35|nr:NAD(P)/FAD-dependent oxidoreductase [Bradyrhizobium archetypum]